MNDNRTIGGMDTLIELQRGVVETNGVGAKRYAFTHYSDVFARIEASDDESIQDDNLAEGARLSVTIYKVAELNTRWRVIIAGKPYQIDSIDRGLRTDVLCTLRVTSINEAR